jgi:hypothetical protein
MSGHEDCFAVCQSKKNMKTITKNVHRYLVARETCSWRCGDSTSAGANPLSEETKRLYLSRSCSSPTSRSASSSPSFSVSSCPFFCPCYHHQAPFHISLPRIGIRANPARNSAPTFPVVSRIRYLYVPFRPVPSSLPSDMMPRARPPFLPHSRENLVHA